ncbi:hypothetical protein APHAL10511_000412 [Amanita phalloides]|nr:hypothetical protein APHAL10511_000412 [Amanita phalloides]
MQGSSPNLGHPITEYVPSKISLQSTDSADELWCGKIIPSPPCSPTVKGDITTVNYGRQTKCQSGFSLDWCPSDTKHQDIQKDTLTMRSTTDVGHQVDTSSVSASEETQGLASISAMPLADHSAGSSSQPSTLTLPKIQPRPNSAPALDSTRDHLNFTLPPRPSSSVASVGSDIPRHESVKVEPITTDILGETPHRPSSTQPKNNKAISMTGIMALGTCQAITSPGSIRRMTLPSQNPLRFQSQTRPLGHPTQVNRDYAPAANHNYHIAGGLVNGHFQTPNIQPSGIPFYVPPHGGIHVPQSFPGRVAQPASNVPGLPTFVPSPANYTQSWAVPGQNLSAVQQPLTVLPFSRIVYPNLRSHANQMCAPQGQKIDATTSTSTNVPGSSIDPFIAKDQPPFSVTKVPRGKRRRTSVSTTSSGTPSLDNSGSGCETGSPTTTSVTASASASTSSIQTPSEPVVQTGPTFICRLDGCNAPLSSVDKRNFNHHLIRGHAFHGSGKRELIRCKWRDDQGEMCGKTLQMQSLVKHVCERHFHSLGMSCTLCGSRQARADNIARHLLVCKPFSKVEKTIQQCVWEDLVPGKPFEAFLSGREAKRQKLEE